MSQLTWVERKVASTLFGEVPSSSFEEALNDFMTAENLRQGWKENKLFVAKCHLKLGQKSEAESWAFECKKVSNVTIDVSKLSITKF